MLKIGIIGIGHIGIEHIKCIKEISEYHLIGFYEPDTFLSKTLEADFRISSFSTVETLINAVDVVDIVDTENSPYEFALACLKQFKHVFISNARLLSLEEAFRLIEIAREANVHVQIGNSERFNPAFLVANEYFDKPQFIETHRLQQLSQKESEISVVLDLMIQDIDIVLSIVNSGIRRISASGVRIINEAVDIANAHIEFDNGSVANLTASRISQFNMAKSRFFQRNKYLTVDFLAKEFELVSLKEREDVEQSDFKQMDSVTRGNKEIVFSKPEVKTSNSIKSELESFYNSITTNTIPKVSLNDAHKALEVAHEIIEKIGPH